MLNIIGLDLDACHFWLGWFFFLGIFISNGNTLQFLTNVLILYPLKRPENPRCASPPYFLQSSVFFEELFEDYFEELQTMFFEVEMIINNAHLT